MTIDELQAAVDEIRAVCNKRGVVLIGTADSVYGEFLIAEAAIEAIGWSKPESRLTNKVWGDGKPCYVNGIGDLIETTVRAVKQRRARAVRKTGVRRTIDKPPCGVSKPHRHRRIKRLRTLIEELMRHVLEHDRPVEGIDPFVSALQDFGVRFNTYEPWAASSVSLTFVRSMMGTRALEQLRDAGVTQMQWTAEDMKTFLHCEQQQTG